MEAIPEKSCWLLVASCQLSVVSCQLLVADFDFHFW
jgi:hypothetical protein